MRLELIDKSLFLEDVIDFGSIEDENEAHYRDNFLYNMYRFYPEKDRPKGWKLNAGNEVAGKWWKDIGVEKRKTFRNVFMAILVHSPEGYSDEKKQEWWFKLPAKTKEKYLKQNINLEGKYRNIYLWNSYKSAQEKDKPKGWKLGVPYETINNWWHGIKPDQRQALRIDYQAIVENAPKELETEQQLQDWWSNLGKAGRDKLRNKYRDSDVVEALKDVAKPFAKVHAATLGRVTSLLHKITHTGPIRDIEKAVQGVFSQIPFFKPFIKFHEQTSARATEQVMAATGAIKESQVRGKVIKPSLNDMAAIASSSGGGKVTASANISANDIELLKKIPTKDLEAVASNLNEKDLETLAMGLAKNLPKDQLDKLIKEVPSLKSVDVGKIVKDTASKAVNKVTAKTTKTPAVTALKKAAEIKKTVAKAKKAVKPAAKPAAKPVAKPAAKATEKPAEKPIQKATINKAAPSPVLPTAAPVQAKYDQILSLVQKRDLQREVTSEHNVIMKNNKQRRQIQELYNKFFNKASA